MDLPPGWLTDIAVLRLSGAHIEDRGDHLVITSSDNPGYHWGNFLLVTDPQARNDASRWVGLFRATFPDARYLGIGLPAEPDPAPWADLGLPVTSEEVMSTTTPPVQRPAPAGYVIHQLLTSVQWAAAVEMDIAENARNWEQPDDVSYRDFATARTRSRAEMSERGAAAFFGAFMGEECVSSLGIVLCGQDAEGRVVARYQSVQTAVDHRRRGLAGHLLGVAAGWAAERGAQRWVIATESDNPAGRLYRSLGFTPDSRSWEVERS
jgi:GNAT superfamily N-acetyltransferase